MAPRSANSGDEPDGDALRTESTKEESKKFRFKSKHRRDQRNHKRSLSPERRSNRRHRHHARRRKTTRDGPDDPSAYTDDHGLPPDAAFRESLFDALGDDEGAQYWEGVYGQPMHVYSDVKSMDEAGVLERMNDEEYVAFVRKKMWEKSAEGREAEREEQRRRKREEEEERERDRDRERQRHKEDKPKTPPLGPRDWAFDLDVDTALKKGKARAEKKRWTMLWKEYLAAWQELNRLAADGGPERENIHLRNLLPWPVESGNRRGVNVEAVRAFFTTAASVVVEENESSVDVNRTLATILRNERVRWHPDKVQQKFGSFGIEESTLRGVTAVFQVIEDMWKENKKSG